MKINNNINSILDVPPQYWNTIGGGVDNNKNECALPCNPSGNEQGVTTHTGVIIPINDNVIVEVYPVINTNKDVGIGVTTKIQF